MASTPQNEKSSTRSRSDYIRRINRVIDYLDTHLDDEITLQKVAEVACFSQYHFHRIFSACIGESLGVYIQRLRLEKAASLLLQNKRLSVTRIALDCGFKSQAAFANAFKKHFGVTASTMRKMEGLQLQEILTRTLSGTDRKTAANYITHINDSTATISFDYTNNTQRHIVRGEDYTRSVYITDIPDMTLAYIRYVGPYKGDSDLFGSLWHKLGLWAGPRGIFTNPKTQILTLYHDNPDITVEEKLRISVAVSLETEAAWDPADEVSLMRFTGGRYAVCRFILGENDYSDAWGWLYSVWLPRSGFIPADHTALERYPMPNSKEEYAEQEKLKEKGLRIVEICIPAQPM